MKILLLAVGKTTDTALTGAIERYLERIRHFAPFEFRTVADVKTSRATTEDRQKELEGRMLLQNLAPGDVLILLDERGKELTSREFAADLDRLMTTQTRNIVFAIGGPYGFSGEVYTRADRKISLSRMTFTHEMVRLFFAEQLYRAFTILRGMPYHHD